MMRETRQATVALNMYWGRQSFFYDDSGNVVYICRHYSQTASADLPDWVIWKHFYNAGGALVDVQKLIGALSDRASLNWQAAW